MIHTGDRGVLNGIEWECYKVQPSQRVTIHWIKPHWYDEMERCSPLYDVLEASIVKPEYIPQNGDEARAEVGSPRRFYDGSWWHVADGPTLDRGWWTIYRDGNQVAP